MQALNRAVATCVLAAVLTRGIDERSQASAQPAPDRTYQPRLLGHRRDGIVVLPRPRSARVPGQLRPAGAAGALRAIDRGPGAAPVARTRRAELAQHLAVGRRSPRAMAEYLPVFRVRWAGHRSSPKGSKQAADNKKAPATRAVRADPDGRGAVAAARRGLAGERHASRGLSDGAGARCRSTEQDR